MRTEQLERHEAEINRTIAVREALFAIMEAFESAPRNRYGKVLPTTMQQNALRRFAMRYGVNGWSTSSASVRLLTFGIASHRRV